MSACEKLAPGLSQHRRPAGPTHLEVQQPEAILAAAAAGLSQAVESLFQSEIKGEKTEKLDTAVFCYLTFASRPFSLQFLSRKPLAIITGCRVRGRLGQASTVAL